MRLAWNAVLRLKRVALVVFLLILLCVPAIFYRTETARQMNRKISVLSRIMANRLIYQALESQIAGNIRDRKISLDSGFKQQIVTSEAQERAQKDPDYQTAVENLANVLEGQMRKAKDVSPVSHYLLEADGYFYYYLTDLIRRRGNFARHDQDEKCFNPLKKIPFGKLSKMTFHPYLGFAWYLTMRAINPDIGLMESLCYFPLVLCLVIAGLFVVFCLFVVRVSFAATFVGGLALLLAPIFIKRSMFGWFDTDSYNLIFPLLTLIFFFLGFYRRKRIFLFASLAGFVTGLYPLFWGGWAYLLILNAAVCVVFAGIDFLTRAEYAKKTLAGTGLYLFSSAFFLMLWMSPAGFIESALHGWHYVRQFALDSDSTLLWPNLFLTVGETAPMSFREVVDSVGNYFILPLIFFGGILAVFRLRGPLNRDVLYCWSSALIFSIPAFILAMNTQRFALLCVLPVSLLLAYGVSEIEYRAKEWINCFKMRKSFKLGAKALVSSALVFLAAPFILTSARAASMTSSMIMNDAWYQVLTDVKENTPENATVNSWWPPGYFIMSLANRAVTFDGGRQDAREGYWISRFWLSDEEQEALRILRMLNVNGNRAVDFLLSLGFDLPDAIESVSNAMKVPKTEAFFTLPGTMSWNDKESFLNLTHPENPPPTYFLVYNDLVEQNLAVQFSGKWNFRRAQELAAEGSSFSSFLAGRPGEHINIDRMATLIDGIWKFSEESKMIRREGDRLEFSNGLMVDLGKMEAVIMPPDRRELLAQPLSLLYIENKELKEKMFVGKRVNVSALLIEREGKWTSVLADRQLLRSMLFRSFYLDGAGFQAVNLFSNSYDPFSNTKVSVFEVDWEQLKN